MKEEVKKCILNIGKLLVAFIVMDILITTIFQVMNIAMSPLNVILSGIITIIISILLSKKKINRKNLALYVTSVIITIVVIIISTYCIGRTFDTSADGCFYHKTAIGLIKEGWNPLYESSEEFCKENDKEIEDSGQFLWIDHYPKVTWNFAASIYSVTNNIESGKVIIVLLAISLACMTYYYLSQRKLKDWQAALIAIGITLNPIVLSQIFTYYVDGVMGLLVYGIILFLVMITDKEFKEISNLEKWLGLASEIILCMNIKFTGVYFAAIFSIIFYIAWLVKSYKEKNFKEHFIKLTLNFVGIVIVGIGIVGASTYVKNTIEHKNPVYPIIGKEKVDIITEMQPQSFSEKNRFVKIFESIFAKSENVTYYSGKNPDLKVPFSVNKEEIDNLAIPDTRIGGYGIIFSGILIIAAIILIYALVAIFKSNKKVFECICIITCGVFVTTIFMAEAWWARYSPQLYLLPILSMLSLFWLSNNSNKKGKKIFQNTISTLIFILMMINICPFAYWRAKDIKYAKDIKEGIIVLRALSENEDVEISFNETNYNGILFNLRDYKINYKLNNLNKENKCHYVYNYQIIY